MLITFADDTTVLFIFEKFFREIKKPTCYGDADLQNWLDMTSHEQTLYMAYQSTEY